MGLSWLLAVAQQPQSYPGRGMVGIVIVLFLCVCVGGGGSSSLGRWAPAFVRAKVDPWERALSSLWSLNDFLH
jgi:hypothetical protein